jgi:hypothetical protein
MKSQHHKRKNNKKERHRKEAGDVLQKSTCLECAKLEVQFPG